MAAQSRCSRFLSVEPRSTANRMHLWSIPLSFFLCILPQTYSLLTQQQQKAKAIYINPAPKTKAPHDLPFVPHHLYRPLIPGFIECPGFLHISYFISRIPTYDAFHSRFEIYVISPAAFEYAEMIGSVAYPTHSKLSVARPQDASAILPLG